MDANRVEIDRLVQLVYDNENEPFKKEALKLVIEMANIKPYFSTADIWPLVTTEVRKGAALGQVFRMVAKAGLIKRTNTNVMCKGRKTSHSQVCVWRSTKFDITNLDVHKAHFPKDFE